MLKGNKPDTERLILHDLTYICNLKYEQTNLSQSKFGFSCSQLVSPNYIHFLRSVAYHCPWKHGRPLPNSPASGLEGREMQISASLMVTLSTNHYRWGAGGSAWQHGPSYSQSDPESCFVWNLIFYTFTMVFSGFLECLVGKSTGWLMCPPPNAVQLPCALSPLSSWWLW